MTYIIIFLTLIVTIAALRNHSLFDRLALIPYRVIHNREWWRVITHGFIHADYIHLAVNMVVLLSFGQFIEQLFDSSVQIVLRNSGAPVIRDLVDYGLGVVTAVGSSGALGSGAPAPVGGNSPKYSATERSK